jgi:L-ascorbate metabolism protein UlaG (beta-lactamase superfamily)
MPLKSARIKDLSLIAEMDRCLADEDHFHLWWLGQSGYLLLWKKKKILIDPYLSDSLTVKYAGTQKPHSRISERVLDPGLLKDIFLVTSSHNHTDHLDGDTLGPLIKNNPGMILLVPEANREFVSERLKISMDYPMGIRDGTTLSFGGFSFHGIPAKHNEIERDQAGNCRFMGYIIQMGIWTIYHSGDTLWFEGMEEMLKPFRIDLALLPINGHDPTRGVAGNLDGEQAARLGKSIGAGLVIPCHYDLFEFNTADPREFGRIAERLHQPYQILELGGHFSSSYFEPKQNNE